MIRTSTLALAVSFSFSASAQLTVTTDLSQAQVADLLEGLGVSVSNVQIDCPGVSMGQFSGMSELGIGQGLVLTTGHAADVAANASFFANSTMDGAGDADLTTIIGYPTYDACAVSFDCIPTGDTLAFNFAFGSEEYPEFVGGNFNDVFGIFMSGPGINGPYANNAENIAWVPGTNVPASINNVNDATNAAYYNANDNGVAFSYDGFTDNFPVFAVVQPGETYHFKVVVADAADQVFDSGVVLEAFSFRSMMGPLGIAAAQRSTWSLIQGDQEVVIEMPADGGARQLQVLDATGKVVAQRTGNGTRTSIPTGGLTAGLYFVRTQDGACAPLRFIKR